MLGLSGGGWITPCLQALRDCGLPGRDFIALGLRKNGSEWGKYPAEYCDMEMMYHYILMKEMKLSAKQAAEYSIHGLKHFSITAATQLEVERTAIEKLGHWHHGSKMRDKQNQGKCVQELVCRTKIQKTIRSWLETRRWVRISKRVDCVRREILAGKRRQEAISSWS